MWINGLTLDRTTKQKELITFLKSCPKRPTIRIVFDEWVKAKDYHAFCKAVSPYADILGELLDSYYMKEYSIHEYDDRAKEYLDTLGDFVSIWEIGNEINGDWLEEQAALKVLGAWMVISAAKKKTALTGYYNYRCEDKNGPMISWLQKNIDKTMAANLDYFLISYYEDDCNKRVVNLPEWNDVFNKCSALFPKALLGFGECGTTKKAKKLEYFKRWYSMSVQHPKFVGGFFWWYGFQDMVAATTLREPFKAMMK